MLSWPILWDIVKVAVFPVLGLIYAIFQQKLSRMDSDIEKLSMAKLDLEKKIIKMESSFVTQDQMRDLFQEFLSNLEKSNNTLETRIEKTMDLKIGPVKDMLSKLIDKK